MTLIANDYDFEQIFARQVEGLMTDKDARLGLSANGNSINVIHALEKAKQIGGRMVLLSDKTGGRLWEIADIAVIVSSDVMAHIHEYVYPIICGLLEDALS